jgi:hypothetical protein
MPVGFDVVLTMVAALMVGAASPRQAPRSIALAISHVAEDLHEAATLVVMAKRESDFVPDVEGDCKPLRGCDSFGTWQLQRVSREVAFDPFAAAPIALARLRSSAVECPQAPLSVYASGHCGWALTLSRSRAHEIERLERRTLEGPPMTSILLPETIELLRGVQPRAPLFSNQILAELFEAKHTRPADAARGRRRARVASLPYMIRMAALIAFCSCSTRPKPCPDGSEARFMMTGRYEHCGLAGSCAVYKRVCPAR